MRFSALFILFFIAQGFPQEAAFKRGEIIDSIPVIGTTNNTFALYLPNAYDSLKPSAIIFVFDPGGRGITGIKPFLASAEKYNYILVCSNNAKNGPYDSNFKITNHLFNYIFSIFSIDERRIYVSGFSGGARLATAIAVSSGSIQGVVGCGAGFGGLPYVPTAQSKFSYVGLVGDRDMNYQEMIKIKTWLDSQPIKGEVFIFEDDHKWPPPEQLLRAFGWLELQAYEKGIKVEKDIDIKAIFLENLKVADTLEKKYNISLAVDEYERIIRNYAPYFKLDSLVTKIKELKKLKNYKKELKDQQRIASLEDTLRWKFQKKFSTEVESTKSNYNFRWWEKEIGKIKGNYVNNEKIHFQKLGERIQYSLFAMAYESSNVYIQNMEFDKALYCDRLLIILRPKSAYLYFRAAQSYARTNDLKKLLQHLEHALLLGMKDKEFLRNTKEFNPYVNNDSFKKLLDKY